MTLGWRGGSGASPTRPGEQQWSGPFRPSCQCRAESGCTPAPSVSKLLAGQHGVASGQGCSLRLPPHGGTLAFPRRAPPPAPHGTKAQPPNGTLAPRAPVWLWTRLEVRALIGASLVRWNVGELCFGCGVRGFSQLGAGGLSRMRLLRPRGSWKGRVPSSLCCLAPVSRNAATGCRGCDPAVPVPPELLVPR